MARKTEASLQRIRQSAQRIWEGAGTDSSDGNISDTDGICMQLFFFYIQEYGHRLAALGVAATEILVHTPLWQCVTPPDFSIWNVIHTSMEGSAASL